MTTAFPEEKQRVETVACERDELTWGLQNQSIVAGNITKDFVPGFPASVRAFVAKEETGRRLLRQLKAEHRHC
jgi:hypothetical protein